MVTVQPRRDSLRGGSDRRPNPNPPLFRSLSGSVGEAKPDFDKVPRASIWSGGREGVGNVVGDRLADAGVATKEQVGNRT